MCNQQAIRSFLQKTNNILILPLHIVLWINMLLDIVAYNELEQVDRPSRLSKVQQFTTNLQRFQLDWLRLPRKFA
jgi:hypothetical protein